MLRDNRVRDYIFPAKIKAVKGDILNAEELTKEKVLQIATVEPSLVRVNGEGYVILDFGKEYYGGVRILTKKTYCERRENVLYPVRIRFGESITECCAEIGEKNAGNDHAVRDMTVTLGSHSDMEFGNTGFRFVRFDFASGYSIDIKSVVAVFVHRDLTPKGYFTCNDERLNEIYATAARTCDLCMQSMLWDGIKRDKLVWMGDMHPEMLTIACRYGYDKCIDDALDFCVRQYRLPEYINNKPSYSLWFVIVLYDWYMQNGDKRLIDRHIGYVADLFDNLDGLVDDNGNMRLKGYFFDWPSHPDSNSNEGGSDNSKNGVKALFLMALDRAIDMYRLLGKNADKLSTLRARLKKGVLPAPDNKQAIAFKALGEKSFNAEILQKLTDGGSKGFSTFMTYYLLDAISACGGVDEAVAIAKEYYGAMLDKGATTFWEDFNIDWVKGTGRIDEFPKKGEEDIHGDRGDYCYKGFRHSLCHGWSSGVVGFVTKYLLGVTVLSAGCKKVKIIPVLPDGINEVKGAYPTPFGVISIEHKRVGGKIVSKINAPKEVEIVK